MRTISALIAATFCALALSGSAFAADRGPSRLQALTPGWLEFRTAIAAEDLWPEKISTTKAQSPIPVAKDTLWPAAPENSTTVALQRGLDVLRDAERVLTNERA